MYYLYRQILRIQSSTRTRSNKQIFVFLYCMGEVTELRSEIPEDVPHLLMK